MNNESIRNLESHQARTFHTLPCPISGGKMRTEGIAACVLRYLTSADDSFPSQLKECEFNTELFRYFDNNGATENGENSQV